MPHAGARISFSFSLQWVSLFTPYQCSYHIAHVARLLFQLIPTGKRYKAYHHQTMDNPGIPNLHLRDVTKPSRNHGKVMNRSGYRGDPMNPHTSKRLGNSPSKPVFSFFSFCLFGVIHLAATFETWIDQRFKSATLAIETEMIHERGRGEGTGGRYPL